MSDEFNLFEETNKLAVNAKENHLTAFFAAVLLADDSFREKYAAIVLGKFAKDNGWSTPVIRNVETQVIYKGLEGCDCPDMRLRLADGHTVLCEHKIDADETLKQGRPPQLERYLRLSEIDGLVYVRAYPKEPSAGVCQNPKYINPPDRSHFLWADFYPFMTGTMPLTKWLRVGFERLGYTPVTPYVGVLWPDDNEDVKSRQSNFGKLWQSTRFHLASKGTVSSPRRCELDFRPSSEGPIKRVHISPLAQAGRLLRIRLEIREGTDATAIYNCVEAMAANLRILPEVVLGELPNGQVCVDLRTPLNLVMEGASDPAQQADRLFEQTVPLLDELLFASGESHV